mgnify:CR=1 FL=1
MSSSAVINQMCLEMKESYGANSYNDSSISGQTDYRLRRYKRDILFGYENRIWD